MPFTTIIILIVIGLLLFGGIGFVIYCDISTQKRQKAEKKDPKNNP
jgi:preprotein translocase subunit Sss1